MSCEGCIALRTHSNVLMRRNEALNRRNERLQQTIVELTEMLYRATINTNNTNNNILDLASPPPFGVPSVNHVTPISRNDAATSTEPIIPLAPGFHHEEHTIYSDITAPPSPELPTVTLPGIEGASQALRGPSTSGVGGGDRSTCDPQNNNITGAGAGRKGGNQCLLCGAFYTSKNILRHFRRRHPSYLGGQLNRHPRYPLAFFCKSIAPRNSCLRELRPSKADLRGVEGVNWKFVGYREPMDGDTEETDSTDSDSV